MSVGRFPFPPLLINILRKTIRPKKRHILRQRKETLASATLFWGLMVLAHRMSAVLLTSTLSLNLQELSAPTTSVIKLRTSFLFHLGPSKLSYFSKKLSNFRQFQDVSPRSQPSLPTAGPQWKTIGSWLAKSRCQRFFRLKSHWSCFFKKIRIPPCHWGICFLSPYFF